MLFVFETQDSEGAVLVHHVHALGIKDARREACKAHFAHMHDAPRRPMAIIRTTLNYTVEEV